MMKQLLALAAHRDRIVGVRVQPPVEGRFHVHVWFGPRMGERLEWFDDFAAETDRTAAIDAVAERALAYCREHGEDQGSRGAFAWSPPVTPGFPAAGSPR